MKPVDLIPAVVVALCALCTAAEAMSTVPYSGSKLPPQPNGLVRDPNAAENGLNPYVPGTSLAPYGAMGRKRGRDRSAQEFLNADPFDPNSVVNSFDRQLYANPYPYDPIYNPYGQSGSPYAPFAPNIPMGQGMPYRR